MHEHQRLAEIGASTEETLARGANELVRTRQFGGLDRELPQIAEPQVRLPVPLPRWPGVEGGGGGTTTLTTPSASSPRLRSLPKAMRFCFGSRLRLVAK